MQDLFVGAIKVLYNRKILAVHRTAVTIGPLVKGEAASECLFA